MRVHFLNENVGGHLTMHLALREALRARGDVDATFFDMPAPGLVRRALGATLPGLGRLDVDLGPLRDQLGKSAVARRHLDRLTGVDAIHVYTHNAALLSVGQLARRPSVVSLDATNLQNAYRLPQRRPTRATPTTIRPTVALERRVYEAATLVVAKSEWAATSLREQYGVPDERIRMVPFGVPVGPIGDRGTRSGLPRITFVGRSMERKGGNRLLRTWRERLRHRARLTLVTLDRVPEEEGLEVRNDIHPDGSKLATVLAETDIFAFPTELDTFGYAALEAMAAGIPVIATMTAALPEIVEDGVTGLLIPPTDEDALLVALDRLLDDPDLRHAMGAAGHQRVVERFDASATTSTVLDVLREAVAMGPRRLTRLTA